MIDEDEGRRVISPRTEKIIKRLLRRLDAQIEQPDPDNEMKLAQEMNYRLPEVHRRISRDKAFEPALRKLKELMTLQFHLRFGDNLALHTSHMRKEARDLRNNSDYVTNSPKPATDVATFLWDDLQALSEPLRTCKKSVPAIKAAILFFAQRYLKEIN